MAAPYRHFADKDALLAEVAEQGFILLNQELDRAAAHHASPRDLILRLTQAYVRWAMTRPDYYVVMFGGAHRVEGPEELRPASRRTFSMLVEAIEACHRAGESSVAEPLTMAGEMWSLMHGAVLLQIGGKFQAVGIRQDAETVVCRAVNSLLSSP